MEASSVDGLECQVRERFRSSCFGTADYEDQEKHYCILHLSSEVKADIFETAVQSKLKDNDFRLAGVYFPNGSGDFSGVSFKVEVDFDGATFTDEADFRGANFRDGARFSGAVFYKDARFRRATFSKRANFAEATFCEEANFSEATFGEKVDFPAAIFEGDARFSGATFSKRAYFAGATFSKRVYFHRAIFEERAIFWELKTCAQTEVVFRDTTIEKPERISFHTTALGPSSFVDVDAQKFEFSDMEWFKLPNGNERTLADEVETIVGRGDETSQSLRKLAKACRRLMNNAEDDRDYPTANEFHYWSMEAVREEGWGRLGLIASMYWFLSGYGERPLKALRRLIEICAVFAIFYMLLPSSPFSVFSTSDICEYKGCIGQAAAYSLSALARLLPAEPTLSPGLFQLLVTVEGLLGPLQIALLLLAVRRKVMR